MAKRQKKVPKNYAMTKKDVLYSFFGAFFLGVVFMANGNLILLSKSIKTPNLIMILIAIFLILCFKIYVNSYRKLKMKHDLHFYEVLGARLLTYVVITAVVSVYLMYIFGTYLHFPSPMDLISLAIVIALPCALGSMLPLLIKQF